MATILPPSPAPATVIDANTPIALCAKEAAKFPQADAQVTYYAQMGSEFYAPGVIVSETLYGLCRQLDTGLLTPENHARAIASLDAYLQFILPPPNGDASLMLRAEQLRAGYGCSRSADGLYIALAEELSRTRVTRLLTFDQDLPKQAARHAPSVNVHLLIWPTRTTPCTLNQKVYPPRTSMIGCWRRHLTGPQRRGAPSGARTSSACCGRKRAAATARRVQPWKDTARGTAWVWPRTRL